MQGIRSPRGMGRDDPFARRSRAVPSTWTCSPSASGASRLVNEQRCYRERDTAPILEAARGEELLNEIEVTLFMGGHHFWQLHLLIDFWHLLADAAARQPRPMGRGR